MKLSTCLHKNPAICKEHNLRRKLLSYPPKMSQNSTRNNLYLPWATTCPQLTSSLSSIRSFHRMSMQCLPDSLKDLSCKLNHWSVWLNSKSRHLTMTLLSNLKDSKNPIRISKDSPNSMFWSLAIGLTTLLPIYSKLVRLNSESWSNLIKRNFSMFLNFCLRQHKTPTLQSCSQVYWKLRLHRALTSKLNMMFRLRISAWKTKRSRHPTTKWLTSNQQRRPKALQLSTHVPRQRTKPYSSRSLCRRHAQSWNKLSKRMSSFVSWTTGKLQLLTTQWSKGRPWSSPKRF